MNTYRLNEEKNGIEIYFDAKPADAIRDELKAAGFRWGRGYWWAKDTDERRALAERLTGGEVVAAVCGDAPAAVEVSDGFGDLPDVRFLWNGIKYNGDFIKCSYSNYVDGITIYADTCERLPRDLFDVENDTDIYTDYFDDDRARVLPDHPLFRFVAFAYYKQEAHRAAHSLKMAEKRLAKYAGTRRAEWYKDDKERAEKRLAELVPVADPGQPTRADVAAVKRERIEKENAEREREHREELERREKELAKRASLLNFCDAMAAMFPAESGERFACVEWSENGGLDVIGIEECGDKATRFSLTAFNAILNAADIQRGPHCGYDKTSFAIFAPDGEQEYEGRYDIGDGDGGLYEHIAAIAKWYIEKPIVYGNFANEDERAEAVAAIVEANKERLTYAETLRAADRAAGHVFRIDAPGEWERAASASRAHLFPNGHPEPKTVIVNASAGACNA